MENLSWAEVPLELRCESLIMGNRSIQCNHLHTTLILWLQFIFIFQINMDLVLSNPINDICNVKCNVVRKTFLAFASLLLLDITYRILNHFHFIFVNDNSWICSIFLRGNPQGPPSLLGSHLMPLTGMHIPMANLWGASLNNLVWIKPSKKQHAIIYLNSGWLIGDSNFNLR